MRLSRATGFALGLAGAFLICAGGPARADRPHGHPGGHYDHHRYTAHRGGWHGGPYYAPPPVYYNPPQAYYAPYAPPPVYGYGPPSLTLTIP